MFKLTTMEWNLDTALKVKHEEGRSEGRAEERVDSIRNLMETMQVTAEKAMELLKIPQQDRPHIMALL